MKTIKNDSYNYIVSYIRTSNGEEYQLVGRRITSTDGAVFDGNGKCLQSTWSFKGWEVIEQRIVRDSTGRVIDLKGQVWKRNDGVKCSIRKFKNKKDMMEWVANYIGKYGRPCKIEE